MRNKFRKSRCRIVSYEELENDPVLSDIKSLKFEEEEHSHNDHVEKLRSTNMIKSKVKIKRWGAIAIIILIILLYMAVRLHL